VFFFRKPKTQEVIILTIEETRIIPIDDLIKSEILTNENGTVNEEVNNNTKEEHPEIKAEDSQIDISEKQNEEVDKVEAKKVEEEKAKEDEEEEKIVEKEKVEENEEKIDEVKE